MRRPSRTSLPALTLPMSTSPMSTSAISTLTLILTLMLVASTLAPSSALAAPCWRPPVTGQVIDHFRAPACPYCSGKRGIEIRVNGTVPVRAVEAGLVTFSGSVAGTTYVVIELTNRWKVTYGRLSDVRIERGQRVVRGARLGTVTGELYFGVRVGQEYRDPEVFLAQQVGRPRLVPLDGTPRRAAPTPTWACAQHSTNTESSRRDRSRLDRGER